MFIQRGGIDFAQPPLIYLQIGEKYPQKEHWEPPLQLHHFFCFTSNFNTLKSYASIFN